MALDFIDGSSHKVNCGSAASLDNIAQKTVMAWIFLDDYGGGNQPFICCKVPTGGGTPGWILRARGSTGPSPRQNLRFEQFFSTASGLWGTPNQSILTATWYHVAVTYDRGSASNDPVMYINAVSQTVTEHSTPSGSASDDSAQDFLIGNLNDNFRSWEGRLSDLRVYNRLLSAAEIQTIHAARGADGIHNGLVARWAMDEREPGVDSAGITTVDQSINRNDGTPSGAPDYIEGVIRSRRKTA